MLKNSVVPMKSRMTETLSRRRSHGGSAWELASGTIQPQDGATGVDVKARVACISGKLQSAMPFEGEDARLTGSTRNLFRRLMGLNVATVMEPLKPVTALAVRKPSHIASLIATQKVA